MKQILFQELGNKSDDVARWLSRVQNLLNLDFFPLIFRRFVKIIGFGLGCIAAFKRRLSLTAPLDYSYQLSDDQVRPKEV